MYRKIFMVALIASTALSPMAYAQMNKHDKSIATYNYNINIVEHDEGGTAGRGLDLAQELDKGVISEDTKPQAPVLPSPYPNIEPAAPSPANAPIPQGNLVPAQNVVQVGSAAPDFTLPTTEGGSVGLKNLIAKGPALVLFTRGSSCAFCVKQMQLLQKNIPQFNALGIRIAAVSPEPMGNLQFAQQRFGLTYPLLNDVNSQVARSFGLNAANGDVTPALFTIDASGKIAAVQLQAQGTKTFDLTEATASVRNQGAAVSAPAPAVSQPTSKETAVPSTQVAPKAQAPAAMPPVPSPQTGKVKYEVPPSNPSFGKNEGSKAMGI